MDTEQLMALCKSYTQDTLDQLDRIEKSCTFEIFNSDEALKLGNCLVEASKNYPNGVAIMITREVDESVIFQYISDDKSSRNIGFANMKRKAVLESQHSSFYRFIDYAIHDKDVSSLFGKEALYVGGAFPIIVNDELVATIAVSGLKEGLDQELILKGLSKYFNKDIKMFDGFVL